MHFTQREQRALRDVGLSMDTIEAASNAVVEATEMAAEELQAFFTDQPVVYSDVDLAHSASDVQEHGVDYLDLYTHADDIRGYLRFDSWGVPVEGGRLLSEDVVELSLGPTVDARVRFATEREAL